MWDKAGTCTFNKYRRLSWIRVFLMYAEKGRGKGQADFGVRQASTCPPPAPGSRGESPGFWKAQCPHLDDRENIAHPGRLRMCRSLPSGCSGGLFTSPVPRATSVRTTANQGGRGEAGPLPHSRLPARGLAAWVLDTVA